MDQNSEQAPVGAPAPDTAPSTSPTEDSFHMSGSLIGIIIVIVLLLAGAAYFFWFNPSFLSQSPTAAEIEQANDPVAESLQAHGTSDEMSSIEQDLGATDLTNLDADVQNIDAEFTQ